MPVPDKEPLSSSSSSGGVTGSSSGGVTGGVTGLVGVNIIAGNPLPVVNCVLIAKESTPNLNKDGPKKEPSASLETRTASSPVKNPVFDLTNFLTFIKPATFTALLPSVCSNS